MASYFHIIEPVGQNQRLLQLVYVSLSSPGGGTGAKLSTIAGLSGQLLLHMSDLRDLCFFSLNQISMLDNADFQAKHSVYNNYDKFVAKQMK